ncbi:hypothetical protein OESDEN_16138, partial [Oesophagostomum dentatum]
LFSDRRQFNLIFHPCRTARLAISRFILVSVFRCPRSLPKDVFDREIHEKVTSFQQKGAKENPTVLIVMVPYLDQKAMEMAVLKATHFTEEALDDILIP